MHEYLEAPAGPAPWPGIPHADSAGDHAHEAGCQAAVSDITTAIGDTRWLVLVSGGLLAADVAGAATVAGDLLGRPGAAAMGSVGLLVPVMVSWLAAVALLLLAERPVAGALGELRRVTGAPVDLAAPWRPLGVRRLPPAELDWSHLVPLIGATVVRHARARRALFAAIVTTAGLLAWLVLVLAIAAVT